MAADTIRFLVSRHAAFYSPLIAAIAAGFLQGEGYEATYRPLGKGEHARDLIRAGEIDIAQAAVSTNWAAIEKGETPADLPVHFAQINQRDGFLLAGRAPDPEFQWKKLAGAALVADHGGQPLAMLRYAAHVNGVDWSRIQVIDAGSPDEMDAAFRAGRGDYVHLQGPAPQQLEKDGAGYVVASVGAAMPPVAFSSLMASREFLATGTAQAFMRAYRKSREWVNYMAPEAVARAEAKFFPAVSREALAAAIARYQELGCWHGGVEISREHYEQALAVFLYGGLIARRHAYEQVVVEPPDALRHA
ncbi:MAG TPA: ABC transporter substrate-binding protein [Bryobacterales bacterium]|nr:ABC transporter substrate-binding protein [Bryobacterales bacterium]